MVNNAEAGKLQSPYTRSPPRMPSRSQSRSAEIPAGCKRRPQGLQLHPVKPKLAFAALLSAVILGQGVFVPAAVPAADNPHDFDALGCEACHTSGDPGTGDLRAGVATVCRNCHTPCLQGRKHVGGNGFPSAMSRPLPLETPSVMTCHTCHAPHDGAVDTAGRKTLYLRIPAVAQALCLNCHGGVRK